MPKIPDQLRGRLPKPQIETFNSGHAKNWFWRALPSPLVTLICVVSAGSITGLALYMGDRFGGGQGYLWSLGAIGVMTVIAGGVAFIAKRRGGKTTQERSAGFEEAVKGTAERWDTSSDDDAEVERLADLRDKFQKGIQVFRDYGKDLYELPWYVVVGEPGSGKSEAIRHSELRFPVGLHDKLQGAGGTSSMHWWFTNNAVLLDTAGAMLTQPEAADRFGDFLRLLREHRTDFPINGLILALPVVKLLTDPPHVAEEKARAIAQQLSLIQQQLDIRFPLYLMITMSDRLTGFREFFDAEGQAPFELQMVGWSNPDPVGTPFDPANIHGALDAVSARLHARALALLTDPIARMEGRRRLDEVDMIYSFPETIRSLKPRLQCYLDTIFQTGSWAAKAPFFRGVYFTSALRQGTQLDEALATALNVDVQKIQTGGIFTQDKAAFLRDVFLSKIFPESGLVTRLVDVGAMLRRRLLLYYGGVLVFLLVALLLTFIVRNSLTRQLANEQAAWLEANATWNNGTLLPPLARRSAGAGIPPTWAWIEQGDPLASAAGILDSSSTRLRYSWVFSPLGEWRDFERRRHETGLSLFEASVMKPVLDAARERIRWDTAENARRTRETEERLAAAYIQLVKLEAWVRSSDGSKTPRPDEKSWQTFFGGLLAYALDQPADAVTAQAARLAQLTQRAYGQRIPLASRGWLAEGENDREYSSLHRAASLLFGQTATQALGNQDRHAEFYQKQQELLKSFTDAEAVTIDWSREPNRHNRQQVEAGCLKPMRDAVKEYDALLAANRGTGNTSIAFGLVAQAARATLDTLDVLPVNIASPLHAVRPQVAKVAGVGAHEDSSSTADEVSWNAVRRRLEAFNKSFSPMLIEEISMSREDMLGNLQARLKNALDYAAHYNTPAATPAGGNPAPAPASENFTAITHFLESYRGVTLAEGVLKEYRAQLQRDLDIRLKFPLVDSKATHRSLAEFHGNCAKLSSVEKDRDALNESYDPNLAGAERDSLREYFTRLQPVFEIKKILLSSGVPGRTDGLYIRIDGARPPEKTIVQPPVPQPGGFFAPSLPAVQPFEMLGYGVKSVTVKIGGSVQYAPATGQGIDVGYNGFADVEIIVIKGQSGLPDEKYTYTGGEWQTLRETVKTHGKKIAIGRSGLGFVLIPLPPFDKWPKRSDFGLAE